MTKPTRKRKAIERRSQDLRNQLVEAKQVGTIVPMTDGQAFLAMIDRAARDPSVDVNKMKELLAMRDADQDRIAKQAFAAALVDCQILIQPIKKNMQADRFKYASLEALDDALRGIYVPAGFALSYNSAPLEGEANRILVMCDMIHRAGHTRHYQVPITVSAKGPKGGDVMTTTQAEGAAVSYGRRYLLLMIFNIITSEDDAAITMKGEPISDEQLWELGELIKETKADMAAFCKYMNVENLTQLGVAQFPRAKDALLAKKSAAATKAKQTAEVKA